MTGETDACTVCAMAKHRQKETPERGGGTHRAIGEPAQPITTKRKPGVTLPHERVEEKAREITDKKHGG